MAKEKICFVIAPIGEADSEIRKRSDQILKHVITPVVKAFDYEPLRADGISQPGMITSQVIQHILEDFLVIADLTDRNPNVFYELALRHTIKRPFIQLIKKGEQIPFDVAGARTIQIDHRDLDSVEQAKQEITAQIHSLETDSSTLETPISVSIDLKHLRESDDPGRRSMGEMLTVLTQIQSTIQGIGAGPGQTLKKIERQLLIRINECESEIAAWETKAEKALDSLDSICETIQKAKDELRQLHCNHKDFGDLLGPVQAILEKGLISASDALHVR